MHRVEFIVQTAFLDQLFVGAFFHDFSFFKHADHIRFLDCGKTVGNHDCGAVFHQLLKCRLHKFLAFSVKCRRRFIKNQEVLNDFLETEAFSELIMKFVSDAEAASNFVNGIIPSDLAKQLETVQKSQTPISVTPAE